MAIYCVCQLQLLLAVMAEHICSCLPLDSTKPSRDALFIEIDTIKIENTSQICTRASITGSEEVKGWSLCVCAYNVS